jgi:hypothetical protein
MLMGLWRAQRVLNLFERCQSVPDHSDGSRLGKVEGTEIKAVDALGRVYKPAVV